MVFQPSAVLKVTPWGKAQVKKKRNKLLWGSRIVTSCIAFTVAQCKEMACKAAPGKAPLGWAAILQQSVLQRHPHGSSSFRHCGQTCFTADEQACKQKLKCSENYLNGKVTLLEGAAGLGPFCLTS